VLDPHVDRGAGFLWMPLCARLTFSLFAAVDQPMTITYCVLTRSPTSMHLPAVGESTSIRPTLRNAAASTVTSPLAT
jgi:hypothetical protein